MLSEFRKFILRGNVIDLAVAVVLGAAFGAIVASLTNDILMPLVGILIASSAWGRSRCRMWKWRLRR